MCGICETAASNEATLHAAANSDRLTGHGNKSHGTDSGGKAKRYNTEEAIAQRHQEAWDLIYTQALNRMLKTCPAKKK